MFVAQDHPSLRQHLLLHLCSLCSNFIPYHFIRCTGVAFVCMILHLFGHVHSLISTFLRLVEWVASFVGLEIVPAKIQFAHITVEVVADEHVLNSKAETRIPLLLPRMKYAFFLNHPSYTVQNRLHTISTTSF